MSTTGRVAGYAAAALAFLYAAPSLYWVLGGDGLLSTVGGSIEDTARAGGAAAVGLGLGSALLKVAGGLLALALIRPFGRRLPRRWLRLAAGAAAALLIVYGRTIVAVGALVLTDVVVPSGEVDRTALRWHVLFWDLWFLLWGLLLGLATVAHRRDRPDPCSRTTLSQQT